MPRFIFLLVLFISISYVKVEAYHPGGVSVGNLGCPAPQKKKSRVEHLKDELEELEQDLEHAENRCEDIRGKISDTINKLIDGIEKKNDRADDDDKLKVDLGDVEDLLEEYVLENGNEERCIDELNEATGVSFRDSDGHDLLAKQLSNS